MLFGNFSFRTTSKYNSIFVRREPANRRFGFDSLKKCRTCETTNRVVEQVRITQQTCIIIKYINTTKNKKIPTPGIFCLCGPPSPAAPARHSNFLNGRAVKKIRWRRRRDSSLCSPFVSARTSHGLFSLTHKRTLGHFEVTQR